MNIIINDVDRPLVIKVASISAARMQVYFIDNEDYFHRKQVYLDENGEFFKDNGERAAFFARGVLETVKKLRWAPDIIHCHGWISHVLPLYLKKAYIDDPIFSNSKIVLSLHDDTPATFGEDLKEKLRYAGVEDSDLEIISEPTGINLAKYIGEVNVTTMISGLDAGTAAPFEKPIESKTLITLSETSTADAPVLKMLVNPMGIQDYMYSVMKAVTVEDMVYWFPEEYALECYAIFTEAIGWNAESIETFTASLDGITFGADGEITFVQDYLNIYDEESIIVPFEFSFTAFDREKAADFSDAAVKPGDDESQPDCTADPAVHLNLSGISYDEFEMEGEGYYVEPSAVIDENGNLVFTFCFDHKNAEDYTRVVATYTPNN
jgi:hypothetical protein